MDKKDLNSCQMRDVSVKLVVGESSELIKIEPNEFWPELFVFSRCVWIRIVSVAFPKYICEFLLDICLFECCVFYYCVHHGIDDILLCLLCIDATGIQINMRVFVSTFD